jgi:hypothetical protein
VELSLSTTSFYTSSLTIAKNAIIIFLRYFATIPSARAILSGDTHVFTSTLAMIWPSDAFKIAIASGEATNQGKFRHSSNPNSKTCST